jgi:predicted nucleotidyltransferase
MGKKIPHMSKIQSFKKRLAVDFDISRMLLFGSFAREDFKKWSDIDLLIVSRDFANVKKARRAVRLYDYWTFKLPVDFLCYTPEEFSRLSKGVTIVREAVREGIEI